MGNPTTGKTRWIYVVAGGIDFGVRSERRCKLVLGKLYENYRDHHGR